MKKLQLKIYILLLSVTAVTFSSCAKFDGYYDRQQVNEVFNGSTYEYLKSKPGVYDSLLVVVERLKLDTILRDSTITLFAVPNTGFRLAMDNLNDVREMNNSPFDYLESVRYEHLDTLATEYIIRGLYNSDSLSDRDGKQMTAVRYGYPMHGGLNSTSASGYVDGGPGVIEFSDTKKSQFTRKWVTTTTSSINIKTNNGIVHVLEPYHVFGFDEFVKRMTFNPPPKSLFAVIGGTLTVSNEYGGTGGANGAEGSRNLVDGNINTKYLTQFYGTNGISMTYELNEPYAANSYSLTSANDFDSRDPIAWNLQGSSDGQTWQTLDTRSGQKFSERFQLKLYSFRNTVPYKFYRLRISGINGDYYFQLAEWSVNSDKL